MKSFWLPYVCCRSLQCLPPLWISRVIYIINRVCVHRLRAPQVTVTVRLMQFCIHSVFMLTSRERAHTITLTHCTDVDLMPKEFALDIFQLLINNYSISVLNWRRRTIIFSNRSNWCSVCAERTCQHTIRLNDRLTNSNGQPMLILILLNSANLLLDWSRQWRKYM